MKTIKLHFVDDNHLSTLLEDLTFLADIDYLSPYRIDNNNIIIFDPITQHDSIDTELVVLSKFARAIKKIIFPNTNQNVEFLNPILGELKGGLVHGRREIVKSKVLESQSIKITIKEI